MARHGRDQTGDDGIGLYRRVRRDIALIGEVEARLDECLGAQQLLAPGFIERAGPTVGLGERLARLRLGLGVDEIGEALDLGEVELAVGEGTGGELAGLRQPHASYRQHRLDDAANHGAAAMDVQLGHVLSRKACRPRQPQHQPAIQRQARAAELAQARPPRLW